VWSDGISTTAANPVWRFLLPVMGLWVVLYASFSLGRPPLNDGPDTIHAEIAREMLARHDWLNPYANGFPITSTSRVLDWSIASSYRLFGVADWSARLPISITIFAVTVIVFFLGRKLFDGDVAGFYAALFLLVWPGTFLATRALTSAPFLCLGTAALAFLLWQILNERRISTAVAIVFSFVACALVVFIAGWPNCILPLAIVGLAWIVMLIKDLQERRSYFLWGWTITAYMFSSFIDWQSHANTTSKALPMVTILPLPPLAILLGGWLEASETLLDKAVGQRIARWIFAIGAVLIGLAAFFAIHGPVSFRVSGTPVLVTTPWTRVPLLIGATALIAGVVGNLIFHRRKQVRIAHCFLAGTLAGLIVAFQVGEIISSPQSSSQILAEAIRPELNSTDIVVIDGQYKDASSLVFYLERPALLAVQPNAAQGGAAQGTVDVNQIWPGSARIFLWTNVDHPLAVSGQSYVIAQSGGKEILSNEGNSGGASF
jgi:hypothetical protein